MDARIYQYQFDIICIYNDRKTLDDVFLRFFSRYNDNPDLYRLHLIDNMTGGFTSAAQAFNAQLPSCGGRWALFIHQDAALLADDWLERCARYLSDLGDNVIAGVAGMVAGEKTNRLRGRNIVRTGPSPDANQWWPWGNPITQPTPVQTVDEFLFIVPTALLRKLPFDADVCDAWHLYAVDYALTAARKFNSKVYVLPLPVYHRSSGISKNRREIILSLGPLPAPYYDTMKKLLAKHRRYLPVINTTCSQWHTRVPLMLQRLWKLAGGAWDMMSRKHR